jgi:erythronate-4-phosphate dehydrogenase
MRIVADSKILFARELFGHFGTVEPVGTPQLDRGALRTADAVLVRSETPVNAALLDGTPVRFVGTATIGTDHVDLAYLASRGIGFASAPGSNANSVGEYLIAALLELERRVRSPLAGLALGVVGVGNVGSIVARYAAALGMRVLLNDPPRARAGHPGPFLALDDLMGCDIVTIHVPLTRTGEDPTWHLFDAGRIGAMKPGSVLINTARGPVAETGALLAAVKGGQLSAAVLDVWEEEPAIDAGMLESAAIATPHIAGYSYDGKLKASVMLHDALCVFAGVRPPAGAVLAEAAESIPVRIPPGLSGRDALRLAVAAAYDILRDDGALRPTVRLSAAERGTHFRRLRAEYPRRREFGSHIVQSAEAGVAPVLRQLGFRVAGGVDGRSGGSEER